MVTSLHDGMNLVAKEYVAARDMEDGVLILSRFAGAAAQLREALLVNPYHIEQTAEALARALTMHPVEQLERMRVMRREVSNFNIYRWAGAMLLDAADARQRVRVQDRIDEVKTQAIAARFLSAWRRKPVPSSHGEAPPPQARRANRA